MRTRYHTRMRRVRHSQQVPGRATQAELGGLLVPAAARYVVDLARDSGASHCNSESMYAIELDDSLIGSGDHLEAQPDGKSTASCASNS